MSRSCGAIGPFVVAAIAIGIGAQVSARPDPGTNLVRMRTAGAFVIVPVSVGDRGVYPFLLDTGSATTLVDPSLALELGMPVTGTTTLLTTSGSRAADLVRTSIVFGAMRVDAVEAVCFPLAAIEEVDASVRGVLGQDILRRSNWLLDYRRGVIEQDLDGALALSVPGERVAMQWSDDRPSVNGVLDSSAPIALVLDSAASGLVVFGAPGPDRPRESIRLKSLAQEGRVPALDAEALQVGGIVFRRPRGALVRIDGESAAGGLLPTSLFETLYFDNDGSSAIVVPRAARR